MDELVERKMLAPDYIKEFKCIGSSCEDSCCAGWGVNVDRKTYNKYKKSNNLDLKRLFNENILRNRKNPSDRFYANIKINSEGRCPFLNQDKLCKVQLTLGEKFLSDTCHGYPRRTHHVKGVFQQSATLSCPQAARLALLNNEGIVFTETVIKSRTNNIINIEFDNKLGNYFDELRTFSIQLVKSPDYHLWEKLIMLGMFFEKVQSEIDKDNIREIPNLVNSYTELIVNETFRNDLAMLTSKIDIQIEFLKILVAVRNKTDISNDRYIECFNEFKKGLHYDINTTQDELVNAYTEAYKNYYEPFITKHEYVLENYIVNYIYSNLFPFKGNMIPFDNYIMLIIHYSLIKMLLIGMSNYHKENFNIEHIIKLIQSFSKVVEHNQSYLNSIIEIIKKSGAATLPYMLVLIKN